ncbi:MAG TPA: hypothetical protein VM617_06605 [Thermoanaerobaculia bacterium]|nr:hypothetical protein [Thermoanaerobaculia bacterium]
MTAPPLATPLRVALGLGLLVLLGLLVVAVARALSGRRPGNALWCPTDVAFAWVAGPAVAVPLVFFAALTGLPLRGRWLALFLGLIVAVTAVGLLLVVRRAALQGGVRGATTTGMPAVAAPPPGRFTWMGRLTLGGALALSLGKIAVVPVWSWDHFAIWGIKARLFAAAGNLDPALVARFELVPTVPHYPLGVPLVWVATTLGALPAGGVVRLFHAGWLLALVVLVHQTARQLSADRWVALAAAAFVAVSPLAWDSVHLGLADLPLALYAVAAVAAAAPAVGGLAAGAGGWALAGLFVGFLPWVKNEGGSLAMLLALVLATWRWGGEPAGRRREILAFATPAVLVGAAAVATGHFVLPRGVSFFDGYLRERLLHRLANPGEVFGPVAEELTRWHWWGAWVGLVVVVVTAVVGRRGLALGLAAVVTAQLALYTGVFFASYLPPVDHVATALPRIAAALVPLVALAAAAVAAPGPPGATFARRIRS